MADIVYTFEGSVYLNITNSCPCKCKFCIRNNSDSVGDADTPRLMKLKKLLTHTISPATTARLYSAVTVNRLLHMTIS